MASACAAVSGRAAARPAAALPRSSGRCSASSGSRSRAVAPAGQRLVVAPGPGRQHAADDVGTGEASRRGQWRRAPPVRPRSGSPLLRQQPRQRRLLRRRVGERAQALGQISCARVSASPTRPGAVSDVQAEQRFGGARPYDARVVDQAGREHRQHALVALLEERRAAAPPTARTIGSGSDAAPSSAPSTRGSTGPSRADAGRAPAPAARVEVWLCTGRPRAPREPTSWPMNSSALARSTAPWRAIDGDAGERRARPTASPVPAWYIVVARRVLFARRSPSPHHASICRAAHSGVLSSWQVVQALGTPNAAVVSGTGGWKV